ncbi:MAG: hypothetical protein K8F56_19690 [Rhodocyclaceae bacterium]|nr:hypothetical protein [Rhodocyclaceae bacterium]
MAAGTGITFHHVGRYFEFVDVEWGSDNSLYFMPKQVEAELGDRLVCSREGDSRFVWKVDEYRSTGFPRRKVSRHQSGYLHVKDVVGSGGRREKNGLRGQPFVELGGFYPIVVMAPQAITTLPEVAEPNPSHIVTHLGEGIEPFTVQFGLWDKHVNVDFMPEPGELLGNGLISIAPDDHKFGLVVAVVNLRLASQDIRPQFPLRTLIMVR